ETGHVVVGGENYGQGSSRRTCAGIHRRHVGVDESARCTRRRERDSASDARGQQRLTARYVLSAKRPSGLMNTDARRAWIRSAMLLRAAATESTTSTRSSNDAADSRSVVWMTSVSS